MSKPLLGPDGRPIPKTLMTQHGDKLFPFRCVDAMSKEFGKATPMQVSLATLVHHGDQMNLVWYALYTLAKDVYSRNPQGSREFQELAEAFGLSVTYTNLEGVDHLHVDIAAELGRI